VHCLCCPTSDCFETWLDESPLDWTSLDKMTSQPWSDATCFCTTSPNAYFCFVMVTLFSSEKTRCQRLVKRSLKMYHSNCWYLWLPAIIVVFLRQCAICAWNTPSCCTVRATTAALLTRDAGFRATTVTCSVYTRQILWSHSYPTGSGRWSQKVYIMTRSSSEFTRDENHFTDIANVT